MSENVLSELQYQKSHRVTERGQFKKHFVLPDFQTIHRGYVKEEGSTVKADEQVLVLETERFSIPELLFTPLDVEMHQMGMVEAVNSSLDKLHEKESAIVCRSILLTGGNAKFPNLLERFRQDLQPYLASHMNCEVTLASDPVLDAWFGASDFACTVSSNRDLFARSFVTKTEYEENGHYYCNEKFYDAW